MSSDALNKIINEIDPKNLDGLAQAAEASERYEDMVKIMAALVDGKLKDKEELSSDQRNLLSVAYKNVVGAKRSSWRMLNDPNEISSNDNYDDDLTKSYKAEVERELKEVCLDVLSKLDSLQKQNDTRLTDAKSADAKDAEKLAECQVFYLKMIGDYYRYLTEAFEGNDDYKKKCDEHYKMAQELAEANLAATHPTRLGLALNYSVCFYEILKQPKKAQAVAKKAFDEAIEKLDSLNDNSYKDSTLIMQLLRDNLTIWNQDSNGDNPPEA